MLYKRLTKLAGGAEGDGFDRKQQFAYMVQLCYSSQNRWEWNIRFLRETSLEKTELCALIIDKGDF